MFGAAAVGHEIICIFSRRLEMLDRSDVGRDTVFVLLLDYFKTLTDGVYQLTRSCIDNNIFRDFVC